MAKISALGLNEWDGTLWDNFVVPLPMSSIDIEIKYFCIENSENRKEVQP